MNRLSLVSLALAGSLLAQTAFAAPKPTPPPVIDDPIGEPPVDVTLHGQFDRIDWALSGITSRLALFGGAQADLQDNLVATNTLVETTNFRIATAAETQALLQEEVVLLDVGIFSLHGSVTSMAQECADEPEVRCNDGIATLEIDDASATISCFPYTCGDDGCLTECNSDADCTGGARCRSSICRIDQPATCSSDRAMVVDAAGYAASCSPYLCSGDNCLFNCSSSAECAPAFRCDTRSWTCVFFNPNPPCEDCD